MGIGIVAIVSADKAEAILKFIRAQKHQAWLIGNVIEGRGEVRIVSIWTAVATPKAFGGHRFE